MKSNPLIAEIPAQPVRHFVRDHQWAVPESERPVGWQAWPVGLAPPEQPAKPVNSTCALSTCGKPFVPASVNAQYCSTKCSRRGEYLRARARKMGVAV